MKNRTTFEKFPRTNAGRSKNWKTLRALCLLLFLSVSFTAYSQITVNVKDISLRASLKKIEQVSNYKFFYNENLPELNQKVSLNVQNATIQQVMKQLLGKMELTYKQEQENIIVLIRKEQEKKRNINVSGTVVDEKGEPVIGASVTVVGTALGTITNLEGKYSLTDVQEDSKVAISFVGYGALTFSAKDKQLARVVLKEDSELLDEVVVIGYGTERKSDLSTAVSQVKSKDFESISYSDPGQAIAGRMPGIYVKQASGAPGGNPQISIRGTGTISSGSSPLVVVDGLPVTDDVGLNSINPNDIESINVLKDVASAAIYGSRAANGVILITTKKGKAGKAQYTFNTYYGVQQVEKKYDLVDAYQQAELMAEAFQYKNQEIPNFIKPYLEHQQGLVNTNWQDHIFRDAPTNYYELSVSGANEQTVYFVSGSYYKQKGIVIGSDYERISGRVNLTSKLSNKFEFGINLNPNYSMQDKITEGWEESPLSMGIYNSYPFFPVYEPDGSYAISKQIHAVQNYGGMAEVENNVATANLTTNQVENFKILGGAYLSYTPLKGLTFKTYVGGYFISNRAEYYRPSTIGAYRQAAPTVAKAASSTYETFNWMSENTITFNKSWGKHDFEILGGMSFQKETTNNNSIDAENFPNDDIPTLNAALTINTASATRYQWALLSYFGRLKYDYKKKYFFTAALRMDGSSRFGRNNRFGLFPSLSAAWRISEENFFPKNDIISELKPRISWGISGNDEIGNYSSLSLMSSAKYNFNGNLVAGMRPNTSPNANLSWEKNNTVNVGLDVGLFRNALNLNFEYYVSKTSDMLLEVPVPAYSGYSTSLQNVGSVRNKGFEFAASFKNHIKDFNYQISANFSTNKNTVLSLGANQNEIITARNITKVGHPIGALYGYRIIGIFENEEQLKSLPNYRDSQKVGDYIFKNIDDSDNTITEKDREIIGNPHPEFTYGGNIQLFYKNFDLGITIQGVYGVDVINRDLPTTILSSEIGSVMSKEYYNNRWISPDKPGKYAKAGSNSNTLSRESDLMMQDGSFFRIRDISLGYTLDKKWLTRTFLTNVRVYVSVKNPLLVSKYMGLNPESEGSSNPLNAGVTLGQYPAEKNFVVGASISF